MTDGGASDVAGKAYWDQLWQQSALPPKFRHDGRGIAHHFSRALDRYFASVVGEAEFRGRGFIEVGCARSGKLPYFAQRFGFEVAGVDYSELGCEQARAILLREGVAGTVVCCDMFSPPASLLGKFDVVFTYGVAEHFEDTAGVIRAFAAFAKPGGLLLTLVPNMCGLNGTLQKWLSRPVFDIHVPLTAQQLREAHEQVGLEIVSDGPILISNIGVVNFDNYQGRWFYRPLSKLRSVVMKLLWLAEALPGARPNSWSSPYFTCVARKR
jgi:2-polyprenyl-3-methyl-5-hydroxy-6-metoxy-1,4-benzoquinol methylase